jgi:uncharacterized repeat protein (TIGR04076 family)
MANINYPQIGSKVIAKVIGSKADCTIGMKAGDEFELSTHKCGEFCGLFYKNISGWVQTLQFGGAFPPSPNPDVMVWDCPNPMNRVQVELRRIKE